MEGISSLSITKDGAKKMSIQDISFGPSFQYTLESHKTNGFHVSLCIPAC